MSTAVFDRILSKPAVPEGQRHADILSRMKQLRANGLQREEAIAAVASVYPIGSGERKITRRELADAYDGLDGQHLTPTIGRHNFTPIYSPNNREPEKPKIKPFQVNGESAPLPNGLESITPEDFLATLYGEERWVCVTVPDDDGKPRVNNRILPIGVMMDFPGTWADGWSGEHGCYFCINPLKPGSTSRPDDNVVEHRFVLVELEVPKDKRAEMTTEDVEEACERFYGVLKASGLPLAAIYTSGGPSVHGLVTVDAKDAKEWEERMEQVYAYCSSMPGLDGSNKNPARLSRLPGTMRGDNLQTLLSWQTGAESYEAWESRLEIDDGTEWFDLDNLLSFDRESDPDCLVGDRWLCRGQSFILQGYTGFGKSSLALQLAMSWTLGRDFFGAKPKKPLKILFIQAENDKGDIAEPFQDIAKHALGLGPEEIEKLKANLIIGRQSTKSGPKAFAAYIRQLISRHHPDLVLCDPLLSYFGGNISDQQTASEFFRSSLQPIQNETGVIFGFVHHFGKPPRAGEQRQGPMLYSGLGNSDIFNWAREIITLTKETGTAAYKLEFGKRGNRAGLVNELGESISEIYLQRATGGKCYWTLSENIASAEDAKNERDQVKLMAVHAFICKHGTVTAKILRESAKTMKVTVREACELANRLVKEPLNEVPIYSFTHKVKGQSGPTPVIYSITETERFSSEPIEIPVIGQSDMIFRGEWYSKD